MALIYHFKAPLHARIFIKNNAHRIFFVVLFFLWTAKLKRYEIHIFAHQYREIKMQFCLKKKPQSFHGIK